MQHSRSRANVILITAGLVLGSLIIGRGGFFSLFSIPSSSMEPALRPGDQILVTRYAPFGVSSNQPRRGDVVVFRSPAADTSFLVKRIVAVPGDHIEIIDGSLILNGRPAEEPYVERARNENLPPEIIPARHYYALGDNRASSVDSRSWGFLPEELIFGRARLVIWSAGDGASGTVARANSGPPGIPRASEPRTRWFRVIR